MYLFIINAFAGNGRGQRAWSKIEPAMMQKGIKFISISLHASNAMELISTYINSNEIRWKAVVIVGGDGTIHSLLPALAGTGIPLALIPAGSGNDTARALGLPLKPLPALDALLKDTVTTIDLIHTSTAASVSELTLTAVATGFDGAIAETVDRSFYKKWCNRLGIGSLAYIIALFQTLASFRPFPVSITVDGTKHRYDKGWLIAVTNTSSYGGGLAICPDADPRDYMLDICIVHSCSPLQLFALFPTILTGKHTKLRYVTMLKGRSIRIEPSADAKLHALGDGEPLGSPPITVELAPQTLEMIV